MTVLYERDYGLWAEQTADLLATGRFLDRLLSSLRLILHYLLKWDYQPQKRDRSFLSPLSFLA